MMKGEMRQMADTKAKAKEEACSVGGEEKIVNKVSNKLKVNARILLGSNNWLNLCVPSMKCPKFICEAVKTISQFHLVRSLCALDKEGKKTLSELQSNTLKIADLINYMASSKPIASYIGKFIHFRPCTFSLSLNKKRMPHACVRVRV